jgi:NADPH:quinone reductase-like Zn-dependent oxidoreductase
VATPSANLTAKPASLPHLEAATLPLAGMTAWQALVDHAQLKPGERVLVQGGAGAVGSYDLLRKGGRLVTLSAPPDQDRAAQRDIRAVFFVVTADPAALSGLAERVGAASLRPLISQVFPLAEGREAYESGQHSRPPGKTLLTVR